MGVFIAIVVEILGIPVLAFSIGLYLPIYLSTPIMVGGLIRWFIDNKRKYDSDAARKDLFPVGRLDKNSVGLLLFTNDGDLTRQLTHPSYRKKKIYQVTLDKPLTRADMDRIAEGITLEDGEIFADEISYVKDNKQEVGIEIHSGRNRIVRRIFEFLGYTVTKLDRVYYAGLTKKNLKRGAWRFLSREEVERLKSGQYE